eukprot:scaffold16802_cov121-Isochrysis_galbana.AAC.2
MSRHTRCATSSGVRVCGRLLHAKPKIGRNVNEDFKVRVTIANRSEKAITLPHMHMQALASLYVRFKIHDGYESWTITNVNLVKMKSLRQRPRPIIPRG